MTDIIKIKKWIEEADAIIIGAGAGLSNAAINNQSTGTITLDDVTINVTVAQQALYNNGVAEIKGSSYLSNTATDRSAVHNLGTGKLTITSGTIASTKTTAVLNAGTMTIGTKDGDIDESAPIIQGETYGI